MPSVGQPTPRGVSESLDAISQRVGSILVRTADGWSYIEPGPDGYVLTSAGPFGVPYWAPPP